MPMNFPDMKSLISAAKVWKFRKPIEGETEQEYRSALADYVTPKDLIESHEIRNKVGWNLWSKEQERGLLKRRGFNF